MLRGNCCILGSVSASDHFIPKLTSIPHLPLPSPPPLPSNFTSSSLSWVLTSASSASPLPALSVSELQGRERRAPKGAR
ncbi:hypothetical protein E2C01_051128 [Portunus trituberculatus]|uniref:Uncharacterized protein n=1 Tax=Portunus trituberculatus TaxID=210409 RepID=A0A5B7GKY4_PORTR|nr:hypothetical protein [Portunus trituberculatus]